MSDYDHRELDDDEESGENALHGALDADEGEDYEPQPWAKTPSGDADDT